MSTPEQIERDIESTRSNLSSDVERLADKVSPGRAVGRRVDRVKTSASSMKERIMGSMPSTDDVGSQLSSAKDAMGGAASSVRDAPGMARRQARGNPLAAGLVAFGVGMLIASLAPVTEPEKQLAAQAEDKAREPLQEHAREVAAELADSAKESAQQVKQTAADAAAQTAEHAKSAAGDVKQPLQHD